MIQFVFKFLFSYSEGISTVLSDFYSVLRQVHVERVFFFICPNPVSATTSYIRLHIYGPLVNIVTSFDQKHVTIPLLICKIILKHRQKYIQQFFEANKFYHVFPYFETCFFNRADFTFHQSAVNRTDHTHVCRGDKAHGLNQSLFRR